jgi:hypothetical protein
LRGKTALLGEDASIQSVCSWYIYEGAKEILDLPSKIDRRKALSKIPDMIRPHIEAEIIRLHGAKK